MLKLYVDFGYRSHLAVRGGAALHSSSLEIGELLTSGFAAGIRRRAARNRGGGRENYDNYLPGLASQSRPDPGHMHYQHPAVGK